LQISWFLAISFVAHDIGESGNETLTAWLCLGAADSNQILWISTNPFLDHCCTQADCLKSSLPS